MNLKIKRYQKNVLVTGLSLFLIQAGFINCTPSNLKLGMSSEAHAAGSLKSHPKKFVAGQIVVKPIAGVSSDRMDALFKRHGGQLKNKIKSVDLHVVTVPVGAEENIAAALANDPQIEFAEVDPVLSPAMTMNDSNYLQQWHHGTVGSEIAWNYTQGQGVTVAVLDTGINAVADLSSQLVPGWNAYDNNSNAADVIGHGTAVAGTLGATGNNSYQVAGVAPSVKVMPIRISDLNGSATGSTMANGLVWAADHGARVASISFDGIPGNSTVLTAARYMRSKGGLVVVAAGNNNVQLAAINDPEFIVVASTEQNDAKSSFSNYGAAIDIAAPGNYILTTNSSGGISQWYGTSFSTPIVAGVVALMMSANPSLPISQIEQLLYANAMDLGSSGVDLYYGKGRVNSGAAVAAASIAVASDTQAPSTSIPLTSGSTVKGVIGLNISATDNVAVSRVELYAGSQLLGVSTSQPYSFMFDTNLVADGNVSLAAKAYDPSGNLGTASVSVTVKNLIDSLPPTVTIKSPLNNDLIKTNQTVSASASDNVAVTSMSVYLDGKLVASSSTGSVSYNLVAKKLSSGTHSIRVDARDASGNIGTLSISVRK